MRGIKLSPFLLFFSHLLIPTHAQGNGTSKCADSGSDWYTNAVGETPCNTYERLRKLCNSNYRVGTLTTNTPPDYCDDQVADCCCNNIAFSLSMLCLTCQVGAGPSGSGVDAGVGAYQAYLTGNRRGFCSPQTNKTLTTQIQRAVCRNEIKIFDEIYNILWSDGPFFYTWVSSTITKSYSALGDGAFSKCPKPSSSSSISRSTSTSTTSATGSPPNGTLETSNLDSESSGIGGGAIAGIVIGVLAGVAAAILALFFCLRRRRSKYKSVVIDPDLPASNSPPPPAPTPYNYSNASHSAGPGSHYDSYSQSMTMSTSPPLSDSNGGASSRNGSTPLMVHNPDSRSVAATSSVARSHSTRKTPASTRSYQPSTSDGPSMSQRHIDAGPVPVSNLSRNPSGRLPPAYGDVVRD